jgi:ATP-dependent protease Clp ATPase subunit
MLLIEEQEKVANNLRRLMEIFRGSKGDIRPHFILTGPSGSGKSHIVKALATEFRLGYVEVNAAQLTKEGTPGNSLSKALTPLVNQPELTLCFVDEFDKLFISGNLNTDLAHETTNGVQNEFLTVLESETTSVFGDYGKYINAPVSNVLFIFAGAFNGEKDINMDRLREFGLKTEFLGRVGLVFGMEKLSVNSMYAALTRSKLLANYLALFPDTDVDHFYSTIMKIVEENHEKNTLGIRLLNTLINQYFIHGGEIPEQKKSAFQEEPVVKLNFSVGETAAASSSGFE